MKRLITTLSMLCFAFTMLIAQTGTPAFVETFDDGLGQFTNDESNSTDWTQDEAGSIINKYGDSNNNLLTSTEFELVDGYMYELTFDHTPYTEGAYDFGYVYLLVKEEDGSWSRKDLINNYRGGVSGFNGSFDSNSYNDEEIHTEPFNVSSYCGNTVKIVFELASDGSNSYESHNYYWLIDGVTVMCTGEVADYTLSFDTGDTAVTVTSNSAVATLPTPEKDGYYFTGWYIDDTLITTGDIWEYAEDKTATASWLSNEGITFFESFFSGVGQFENDENNQVKWTQAPAGTIINKYGNYNNNLLTSSEINLTEGEGYQLTFDHTPYTEGTDISNVFDYAYVYVLVKESDNSWSRVDMTNLYQGESTDFRGYFCKASYWNEEITTEKFDLTAFSGKTIKLQFKLVSDSGTSNDEGYYWKIDQVMVENSGALSYNTLSFDTGDTPISMVEGGLIDTLPIPEKDGYYFNGWYIGDTPLEAGDAWSYTEDQTATASWLSTEGIAFFESFFSGVGQFENNENNQVDWTQDLAGTIINKYSDGNTNKLTSSEIELEAGKAYTLTFDHTPFTEYSSDKAYVHVLVKERDNSWKEVDITQQYQGENSDYEGYFGEYSISENETITTETFNLSPYSGQTIKLEFKLTSNYQSSYESYNYYWEIEQVKVACTGEINSYNLSFDTGDAAVTVIENGYIPTLPTPVKADYIFNGWYIDDTLITAGDIWEYTEDKTATASWIDSEGIVFYESFVSGLGQFENGVENGTDWTQDTPGNIINKYDSGEINLLTSSEIELELGKEYDLIFDHTPYTEGGSDKARVYVLVKNANGSWNRTDITEKYTGNAEDFEGYFDEYSYNNEEVATETFDLAAFTGCTIKIQFDLATDGSHAYDYGKYWRIEQVKVEYTRDLATYNLSFDTGDTVITVAEGSVIPALPQPEKAGCLFMGWYIDDTPIKAGDKWEYTEDKTATASWLSTDNIAFLETFNGGLGLFENDAENSTDWTQDIAGTIINKYGDDNTNLLTSSEIELEMGKSYALSFDHTPYTEGGCDYAYVYVLIKNEDGSWNKTDITELYTGNTEDFEGYFDEYSYENQEVASETFNLAAFGGNTIKIQFELSSDGSTSYERGYYWTIEQVMVECTGVLATYNLSFDTGDAAISIVEGGYIPTLPQPEKAGYYFTGWYIDDTLINKGGIWEYTEDKTAVAHWINADDVVFFETFNGGLGLFENDAENSTDWTQDIAGTIINKYDNEDNNLLTSSEITLEKGKGYRLLFDHIPYTEGGCDEARVYVLIKNEDGSWNRIDMTEQYTGNAEDFEGYFDEDSYGNKGVASETFNLVAFGGNTIKIQFELTSDESVSYSEEGLYWTIEQVMVECTGDLAIYNLSFDTGDATISIVEGGYIPTLPVPEKDGYYFIGWYIDDTQIKAGSAWEYTEDKTATASWISADDVVFFETFNEGLGLFENDAENSTDWTQDIAGTIINKYGYDDVNLLTSSDITLPEGSAYQLTFNHTPYTEEGSDEAEVYVWVKGEDDSWSREVITTHYRGDITSFKGYFDEAYCEDEAPRTDKYSLTAYNGKTIRIEFKLSSDFEGSYEDGGYYWTIDHVIVSSTGEIIDYTLSFDTDDTPITVMTDSPISTLPTPEKDGYIFLNWCIDGKPITSNTVWNYTEDKVAYAT